MRAASHEGLVGSFSPFLKIPHENVAIDFDRHFILHHQSNNKKMSPPEVFHEGFSKERRNFPPIPHDWLPSCITSISGGDAFPSCYYHDSILATI